VYGSHARIAGRRSPRHQSLTSQNLAIGMSDVVPSAVRVTAPSDSAERNMKRMARVFGLVAICSMQSS